MLNLHREGSVGPRGFAVERVRRHGAIGKSLLQHGKRFVERKDLERDEGLDEKGAVPGESDWERKSPALI
jgi:hypothetical protein